MPRLDWILLTTSLLSLSSLTACDEERELGSFATATTSERARLLTAASGFDAYLAHDAVALLPVIGPASVCPKVERSGETLTVTGDCIDVAANRVVHGSISGTNVNLPLATAGGNNPAYEETLVYDAYGIDDTSDRNDDWRFDGKLVYASELAADLTTTAGGIAIHSDAAWNRGSPLTTVAADSFVELDGFGAASIAGQWSFSKSRPAGVLELHGQDVLELDLAAMVDGCAPITLDGAAAGELCLPDAAR